jgi:hypothetical protein
MAVALMAKFEANLVPLHLEEVPEEWPVVHPGPWAGGVRCDDEPGRRQADEEWSPLMPTPTTLVVAGLATTTLTVVGPATTTLVVASVNSGTRRGVADAKDEGGVEMLDWRPPAEAAVGSAGADQRV